MVQRSGARAEGPLPHAQVVEQVRRGLLGPRDLVAERGRPFVRMEHHLAFGPLFVPGDPARQAVEGEREREASEKTTRKVKAGLGTAVKVGGGLAAAAAVVLGVAMLPEGFIDGLFSQGKEGVDAASLEVQKALDADVARKELQAQKGLPGQAEIAAIQAAWPGASGSPESRLDLAKVGLAQGTAAGLENARKELEFAVAVSPEHPEALGLLSVVYAQLSSAQPEKARASVELLARAQQIAPDSPLVIRATAGVALAGKSWAEAEAQSRACLEKAPDEAMCHWFLGEALFQQGRYLDAEAELSQAVVLLKDAPAVDLSLGRSALETGQLDKASRPLEAYAARYPDDAGAHWVLARLHRASGAYDKALSEAKRAVELDPLQHGARLQVGALLLHFSGKPKEAAAILVPLADEKAQLENEVREAALLQGSIAARLSGDKATALRLAEALAERHPGWAPAQAALGQALVAKGDKSAAEAAFKEADVSGGGYDVARFHVVVADFYSADGRDRLADIELQAAKESDSVWFGASPRQVSALLRAKDGKGALATILGSWTLDPDLESVRDPVVNIPLQEPDYEQLSADLRSGVEEGGVMEASRAASLGVVEAWACVRTQKRCAEARESLEALGDRAGDEMVSVHAWLGRIAFAEQKWSEAADRLGRALANDGDRPLVLSLRGLALARSGKSAEAAKEFEAARRLVESGVGVYWREAESLRETDPARAREVALEAMRADPLERRSGGLVRSLAK